MKLKALDALDLAHVEQVKSPVFLLLSIVPSSNWFGTLVAKVEQVPQIAKAGLRLANLMQRSPRSLITRLSNELVEYRTKHALAMREPKAASLDSQYLRVSSQFALLVVVPKTQVTAQLTALGTS